MPPAEESTSPAEDSPTEAADLPVRGRRLQADDRRGGILAAARAVFAQKGYASSNVAHICEAAGIARGTFYIYFQNKPAILVALLEGVEQRIQAVVEQRLPFEGGALRLKGTRGDVILRFCEDRLRELLDAVCVDEQTLRILLRDARAAGGIIERTIARIDDIVLAALERDLAVAQGARILRAGDTRLMARFILGGVEKILLLALGRDEPLVIQDVVRETVHLELFGLLSDEVRAWR